MAAGAQGHFAGGIGLVDALQHVLVTMKTVTHTPGDKLMELLVRVLTAGMRARELETGPLPLVRDGAVTQAWRAGRLRLGRGRVRPAARRHARGRRRAGRGGRDER